MSIDVGFTLRMNTAAFKKGIASANEGLESLKKTVRGGDLGNGIKRLLGAGAIIEVFRAVIDHAAETRKALEEMGRPVPASVAGVAQLADAWTAVKKGALDAGVEALAVFTRIGERAGDVAIKVGSMFGRKGVDPTLGNELSRAADKAEENRDKASKARMDRNTPENLRKLREQIKDAQDAKDAALGSEADRVNKLLEQQVKLRDQLSALERNPDARANDQAKILEKILAIKIKGREIDAATKAFEEHKSSAEVDKKNADRTLKEAQEKLLDSKRDRFLPSIEALAHDRKFGENDARSVAIENARRVQSFEMQARMAGAKGDYGSAVSLQGQADKIRASLTGFAKSDEVNRDRDQVDAVDKATDQLKLVNEKLNSIFKAQP